MSFVVVLFILILVAIVVLFIAAPETKQTPQEKNGIVVPSDSTNMVADFIVKAKEKAKAEKELKRDNLLISLGLYTWEDVYITSEERDNYQNPQWSKEHQQFYVTIKKAIAVSDEEFEEIKKYAPNQNDASYHHPNKLENSAEKYLGTLNNIQLALYVLGIIILLGVVISELAYSMLGGYVILIAVIIALIVLFMAITAHSITKVILNISNNLHYINSKIK